jgi:hypothetical protein
VAPITQKILVDFCDTAYDKLEVNIMPLTNGHDLTD